MGTQGLASWCSSSPPQGLAEDATACGRTEQDAPGSLGLCLEPDRHGGHWNCPTASTPSRNAAWSTQKQRDCSGSRSRHDWEAGMDPATAPHLLRAQTPPPSLVHACCKPRSQTRGEKGFFNQLLLCSQPGREPRTGSGCSMRPPRELWQHRASPGSYRPASTQPLAAGRGGGMPEHPPARQGWDRATRPPVQHPALPAKPWKPAGLGKEYPAPTASLPMGEHGRAVG